MKESEENVSQLKNGSYLRMSVPLIRLIRICGGSPFDTTINPKIYKHLCENKANLRGGDQMKRNQKISLAATMIVLAVCAATYATAHSWTSTPLYTIRMEKASNKMHFLPTAVNGFTYTTENGYTLNYDVTSCDADPLGKCTRHETTCLVTCPVSCAGTCDTCQGIYTCDDTSCQPTCPGTCDDTCWVTCSIWCTVGGSTCKPTCELTCNTCPWTCENTCAVCE